MYIYPRVIVQYWHDGNIPSDVFRLIETWRNRNPDWEHRIYDRASAENFIRSTYGDRYLKAFQACALPAMQSDFFRYTYIYHSGGVYVDAGIECLTPLEEWLSSSRGVVLARKWHGNLWNGFLRAPSGNALMASLVNKCVENVEKKVSDNVWRVTGPGVLKSVVDEWQGDSPIVIEWKDFLCYCRPHHDLEHKKKNHWSEVQKRRSIYNDAV